jgi:hypothetical protein
LYNEIELFLSMNGAGTNMGRRFILRIKGFVIVVIKIGEATEKGAVWELKEGAISSNLKSLSDPLGKCRVRKCLINFKLLGKSSLNGIIRGVSIAIPMDAPAKKLMTSFWLMRIFLAMVRLWGSMRCGLGPASLIFCSSVRIVATP